MVTKIEDLVFAMHAARLKISSEPEEEQYLQPVGKCSDGAIYFDKKTKELVLAPAQQQIIYRLLCPNS